MTAVRQTGKGVFEIMTVKKLIFFTNPNKPNAGELMVKLAACARDHGIEAIETSGHEALDAIIAENADAFAVVTLGGDGTILRAVNSASRCGIPVLGVNMGRIGFFSEIGADEFELALDKLTAGDYRFECPAMLSCFVNGEKQGDCLNEFSVHRQELASITQLRLVIDGDEVGTVMADGLIVGTPSGSTAYTMSAGGPVVAPRLECLLVTPICPHSLTVRPIVAAADSVITAAIECTCRLSGDGQNIRILEPGDEVVFRRSERTAKFIRFGDRNVFRLIREKLK